MLSNVLDIRGEGMGTFLDFGGTKTRLWVHYKLKININSNPPMYTIALQC